MPGKLYVVATPIGNLADMTPRGVQVLSEADIIAAEDTRHSKVLLAHFGIRTPSFSCHKFNEDKRGDFFVKALLDGKDVALISDAGTPCISDPGHRLVRLAAAAGAEVVAVCGASAVIGALSVSGFDASRFVFLGFLPRKTKELAEVFLMQPHLQAYVCNWPLVFYESPLRITKTLEYLSENYPYADICLCNDLTKKFERVYRGTPRAVLADLLENPNAGKGEYACVVQLNDEKNQDSDEESGGEISLEAQLVDIMVKQSCTLKEAAGILHQSQDETAGRLSKKAIYAATLRLKDLV